LLYHEHFDVVNFHFQFPALFGVPVARLHSVAAVYWAHTPFWGTRHAAWQYTNRVLFWPERHALSVVDKVVVGTQGTARNICMELGLPANRIEVIPYGLPDEWFQPLLEPAIPDSVPWHDDGPLVLTVGVITPRKNQELLMRAIPLVLEQMPEAKFAFAGPIIDRRYAERLQAMAREKGIDGHVRFLGDVPRDALRGLYQASSAFVFTSYAETTGVVLLEAMASRVPILMASAMEVREVVPSDCAMFAPVGDHEALARAIIALLRSREARERLREAGWRYVYGRHRWSEVVGRFVELYRRLAQPNGGDDFGEGGQ
jgi:1,4-alpha-glucan branching enzyme